jgi:hypothetical protein
VWGRLFVALAGMAMPTWVRQSAWGILRGAMSWGADRSTFDPAAGYCRFCRQAGNFAADDARHFTECPRNDAVWLAVEKFFDAAGWVPVVRRWFLLYGPETAEFGRQEYDTVVWVWAAAITVMANVHRRRWERPTEPEPSDSAMVAGFQAVIRQAAAAELYAAEAWTPPAVGGVARWGQRQARSVTAWTRRWKGIAQCCGDTASVRMFYEHGFDEDEARLLVGRRRQEWSKRRHKRAK